MTEAASTLSTYRGRLAPSPTGLLHLGHARTFWKAQQRARENRGVLVLRNEDLDPSRCRPEFAAAMMQDLRWFGFEWSEGPDCGGRFEPYEQSRGIGHYREAFARLRQEGRIYPCYCSRRDIRHAMSAPHLGEEEPIYPGTCRPDTLMREAPNVETGRPTGSMARAPSWRFLVQEGQVIEFEDRNLGCQRLVAGRDFGDFVVWRHDEVPSYQLAVVVDDARMQITEIVRGADLLISTARQILLYGALGWKPPEFYHCPLMLDESGRRLAKRHDALSLRALRESGMTPDRIRKEWE